MLVAWYARHQESPPVSIIAVAVAGAMPITACTATIVIARTRSRFLWQFRQLTIIRCAHAERGSATRAYNTTVMHPGERGPIKPVFDALFSLL